jgi:hypothetical protein
MNIFNELSVQLHYGKKLPNIVNYTILIVSILLAFLEFYSDYRMYMVLCISTIIQLSVLKYTLHRGISIIYCFLIGFLIAEYFKQDKKKMIILIVGYIIAMIVSYITLYTYNQTSFVDFCRFFVIHCLFVVVGSLFSFIPKPG